MVPTPIGIDMAKDTFQVELVLPQARRCKEFANTRSGFIDFLKWCHSFGAEKLLVCMEATGRYGEELVTFLYAHAHDVRVANGRRIRRFAEALGLLNKTDKADAHAIAEYALHHGAQIPKWKPLSAARQELRDLRCLINGLQKTHNEYGNRRRVGVAAVVRKHIDQLIAFVEERLEEAKAHAAAVIEQDEQLKIDKAILMKQIGVKEAVSTVLLTRVDFRSFKSARQVARYLGLTPKREQSGTSIHKNGRISKEGPPDARAALFMAARTAIQHDPSIRSFAERLRQRGKPSRLIEVAVMRKIAMRSWSLVVHGRVFDVEYKHPLITA